MVKTQNKSIKTRTMMYVQQLQHLPTKTMDNLIDCLDNKLKPEKYALILQDKDVNDKGQPVEPHIHAMLKFKNARSVNNIAKLLGDQPQSLKIWNDNFDNGLSYLIHATKKAAAKYQYPAKDVIANFDYVAEMERIQKAVSKFDQTTSSMQIKHLLDLLYIGKISKSEVEKKLTGSQYGKYRCQIENVWAKYLQNNAAEWREKMVTEGKNVNVIWIFGQAGTGKTSLAKEYAKKSNNRFFISGSSRDIFQNYSGEPTLIIDEFRPDVIPYQDLLRITDPFGLQVMAPSRYNDKALACDLIIITSPYSPLEFYRETFGFNYSIDTYRKKSQTDTFEQLNRRITLTLEMNEYWINAVNFDEATYSYKNIPNASRKNDFVINNQSAASTTDKIDLFNSMFELNKRKDDTNEKE